MDATTFATKTVGTNGLEQITHTIDNTLQVDSNFATEYRYRGGDSIVKNYVTFNNETWRIIGIIPTEDTNGNVENRFKIIRDESIGNMYWNTNDANDWTNATLNRYLNNNYYDTLNTDAKNMIGTTKYYLGGYNNRPNFTSDVMWQYERKNEANRSGYYYGTNPVMQNDANKKIALMYASDYGYGASKECTSDLYNYDSTCKPTKNWLDKSQLTWLLPQHSGNSSNAFYASSGGGVINYNSVLNNKSAARPVLSLSSNIQISGGKGTSDKPYQLDFSNKAPIITNVDGTTGTAVFYVLPSKYEITGYIATDTDTKPDLNNSKWTNRVDTCNFTSGTKYFWVKDSAGNISDPYKGELSKAPCGVPEIS